MRRYFVNALADFLAAALFLSMFYVLTFQVEATRVSAEQAAENAEITQDIEEGMSGFDSAAIAPSLGQCVAGYLIKYPEASSELLDQYANEDSGVYYRVDKVTTVTPDGSPLCFTVADIAVNDLSSLHRGFANDTYNDPDGMMPADFLLSTDGILGCSGDNYHVTGIGLVVKDGVWYREEANDTDICALMTDGTVQICPAGSYTAEELRQQPIWELWSFGPGLLDGNGDPQTTFNTVETPDHTSAYLEDTHPRTVFGYIEPGHYILLVVDGRNEEYSVGLGLSDLARLCSDLRMTAAYNLDGGRTSSMMNRDGLLNQPCGKVLDTGERTGTEGRPISDIIYIEP